MAERRRFAQEAGAITDQSRQSDGLEINEDPASERRTWRVERMAWFLMMLIIAAALAGLFGSGPLSRAQAKSADGRMEIEYQRLTRYLAPATLRILMAAGAERDELRQVWLNRDFLNSVQLESIIPEPERMEAAGGGVICFFRAPPSDQPTVVSFGLKMQRIGLITGQAGLNDQTLISFRQFVWP